MAGVVGTLRVVVEGRVGVGVEAISRGVGGVEGVKGLEELEVVVAALPLPCPWLASSPQLQLFLPSLFPPRLFLFFLLLFLIIQLLLLLFPARAPSLSRSNSSLGGVLGLGPCLHGLRGLTVLHAWGSQVLGQAPPCTSSCQSGVSLEPQEVGAQVWGLSQLLLPTLLLVASSCRGLLAVLGAVPETGGGWRAHTSGSGVLGVPGPAGEVQSVPAPSVLCLPHPVSGQGSLGV